MKIIELHRSLIRLVLILAMLFLVLAAFAQNKSAGQQRHEPDSFDARSQKYDLEVKEGVIISGSANSKSTSASLANVIDAVRNRYPDANIAISPGLGNIPVSDLKLRTSSLPEELEAIRVASGGKFEWSGGSAQIDPATGLPNGSPSSNKGLFTLREPTAPENQRVVEAFNIGPYLQSWREDEPDTTVDKAGRQNDKTESKELRDSQTNEM